jgi:hypothetical protein
MSPNEVSDDETESLSQNWEFQAGPHDAVDSYLLEPQPRHTNDLEDDEENDSREGLLIIDSHASSRQLSFPETIPSDVGSIQPIEFVPETNTLRTWNKKQVLRLLMVLLACTTAVCAVLAWSRCSLMKRNQLLEAQVQMLQAQLILAKKPSNKKQFTPQKEDGETFYKVRAEFDWENEDFLSSSKSYTVADNCWFKAKIEVGDCLENAKDCWKDYSSKAYTFVHSWLSTPDGPKEATFNLTHDIANAAAHAWGFMRSWTKRMDDSVLEVVEQTRDAVEQANIYTAYL